ncbi:MAG: DUF4465 domain-containing protein [Desulfobacteraceae bacterium]|jgi:hypothetical protein
MMNKYIIFLSCLFIFLISSPGYAGVADFDDLYLAPDTYWGGAGSGETGFEDGGFYFPHLDSLGAAWNGFVYTNMTDTTTAGHTNQFSAFTGGGYNSANYSISYIMIDWMSGTYDPVPETVSLTGENYNTTISGAYFTNTTYAALSMMYGDSFAKAFGGESGDDPDWFKMIIKGIDEAGEYTGTIEFYLADFRFEDNSLDYIIDEWTWVDLSGLGNVIGLEFSVDSSDDSAYGINTPAYFAMDNLNGSPVPVPGAVWLLGSGILGLIGIRRKLKH